MSKDRYSPITYRLATLAKPAVPPCPRCAVLVEQMEVDAKNAAWYNESKAKLMQVLYRLREHSAQGRLDSDVAYMLSRIKLNG